MAFSKMTLCIMRCHCLFTVYTAAIILILCYCHSAECHSSNCHSAEYHSSNCHSEECHSRNGHSEECHSSNCHSEEYHSSNCHSEECHSSNCHSAECVILQDTIRLSVILLSAIILQ